MSDTKVSSSHHHQFDALQGVLFALSTALLCETVLGFSFAWKDFVSSLGRFAVIFLTLFVFYRFAVSSLRSFKGNNIKNLITLNVVLIGSVLMIWIGRVIALSVSAYASQSKLLSGITVETLSFAIPWATGILVLQAILGLQFAFIAAMCVALFVEVYFPNDSLLVPYVLCTCLVAALSLIQFRSRSAYIRAGFNVALISLPLSLASFLVIHDISAVDGIARLLCGFTGGVICAFLAAGFTPLFEYFGSYVTDMRLIESATLDHPLLKELSIQAPGTWNHSMVMGMMAESAANAVGANSVLARVGAYFHDIGKMMKPLYFVENQMGLENRHDKLSTSMSALIIRSHVKDGIELAKKHTVPQNIQDMISQHHGTSIIEYFYEKAVKEQKDAGVETIDVDKSLYSYPGPKPQTKEAGILMLADSIEAAARTLSDHSADRIQGMVQKLINKIFASGELNECELTLQDLHRIAKSFTRVLTGIYHQRIAYAEPAEKVKEDKGRDTIKEDGQVANVAGGTSEKAAADKEVKDGAKAAPGEDLKRLGLS